jgi:hypothetical protein
MEMPRELILEMIRLIQLVPPYAYGNEPGIAAALGTEEAGNVLLLQLMILLVLIYLLVILLLQQLMEMLGLLVVLFMMLVLRILVLGVLCLSWASF